MHLNPDKVKRYLLGDLDVSQAEAIESHLSACQACEETLRNSDVDRVSDRFVDLLRGPEPSSEFDGEPGLKRMLGQASRLLENDSPRRSRRDDAPAVRPARLGEYELGEPLGSGGMGAVYRAFHRRLRRPAAIKLLRSDRLRDPSAVERFEREMEAVGRLEHPHIVRALDAGEAEGVLYLVMELADGLALSDWMQRLGPLDAADACEAVRQAALGIAAAHRAKMIHRDVKPGNLMLARAVDDEEGPAAVVKVLDLGLARLHDPSSASGGELTSAGQVMGTVDYMAPEQAVSSREAGPPADVYSLGATLYRLLAGRGPLDVAEDAGIVHRLAALASRPVPPIESLRPELPRKLARLIGETLARDPDSRPSASELARRLAPFSRGADLGRSLSRATAREASRIGATTPTASSAAADVPTTDDARRVERGQDVAAQPERTRRSKSRRLVVAAAAAALLGLAAFGAYALTTLRIRTPHGTIVLDVDEPGAVVEVIDGEKVEIRRASDGETLILSVDPGRKRLKVSKDGFEIFVKELVIGDEEEKRIVARLEAAVEPAKGPVVGDDIVWEPGPETEMLGLVPRPAKLPGVARWQLRSISTSQTGSSWSPDGELLALSDADGTIWIVDGETRETVRVLPGHEAYVQDLQWSPDGRWLASAGSDKVVRLWTREGDAGPVLEGHGTAVLCVRWAPDGTRLASGGHWGDESVRIWTLEGALERTISVGRPVRDVAWSPDGSRLAVVGDDAKEIMLFDSSDGSRTGTLGPLPNVPSTLAWHDDGRLASNGGDWKDERIGGYVWDVEAARPVVELEQPNTWINHLAWSEGGALAASTQDDYLQTYDLATGKIARRTQGILFPAPTRPSWNRDGSQIAGGNGRIFGFAERSERLARLHDLAERSCLRRVAWSAEGRIAAAGRDRTLRIWSADGRPEVSRARAVNDACPIAWNRAGKILAHSDLSGNELQLTTIGEDAPETVGRHEASISAIAFGPDDSLVVGDEGGRLGIQIPGEEYRFLEPAHGGRVLSVVWSADGSKFATSAADDVLHVWNRDGTLARSVPAAFHAWWHAAECSDAGEVKAWCAAPLEGGVGLRSHDGSQSIPLAPKTYVGDFAWCPDGSRLATLHPKERYAFLARADGTPIAKLRVGIDATELAWHDDGSLAVVGIDGTIRRWSSDGAPQGFTVAFADDVWATFAASGQLLHGEPRELVGRTAYMLETEDGERLTLDPVRFDDFVRSGLAFNEWRTDTEPVDEATECAVAQRIVALGGKAKVRTVADDRNPYEASDTGDALPGGSLRRDRS